MRKREGQIRVAIHNQQDDLCDTAEINNVATTNIRNGDYEQSLSKLEYALKLVAKQIRLSSAKNESSCLACRDGPCPPRPGGGGGFSPTILPTMVLSFETDEGLFAEEKERAMGIHQAPAECRFPICRSPLRIQIGNDPILPSPMSFEVFSFVILYNLALSWQLKSLDTSNPATRAMGLRKSLKLYEHANRIVTSGKLLQGNPLPYMALICNLGSLYMSINDHGMAVKCQEYLLSSIMCWIDTHRRVHHEWHLLLECFLANAMLRFFEPRTAPAA